MPLLSCRFPGFPLRHFSFGLGIIGICSCHGERVVAVALCHSVVKVLLGWRQPGERVVAGLPLRFVVAALQHHRQWEGRAVVVVGMLLHLFLGVFTKGNQRTPNRMPSAMLLDFYGIN